MKFTSSKTARILKEKGRITKPSWGDVQWLSTTEMGVIQHYMVRGSAIYFERYVLSFDDIFTEEWEILK